ncbi:Mucin-associated surface protein (MASP) [Trypanosoma cruzi]|uniref:Mucin-associated surface protein (MASP), putative n=2 Tax=Trypanosoma cruzi TaxID=5693 RepID=Q4E1H7_TRYCC|nr:mucin-associated surface protein (MASP), putative [Trypanosoma cruzi]EAN98640.1 mucin-associated surface protein (MASP), putative [Trypanosoma cruzi]KAF8291906.1 Mucin-associated surface protein (MASP), subgroup S049 [Trypanosoma cruzi]PWV17040.1 Mucin-associated surface protein (MASP) [Trypanosoma cruzi]|eukprot:XP_820491.1 mucin-associated surface protein (MASP) [Trypanosoma cruzi strain CL Brener]
MAMMMTGRVLLVCALCVLWCGTPGGRCEEGGTGEALPVASSSVVGKSLQEPSPIGRGELHNPGLNASGITDQNEDSGDEQPLTEEEEEEACSDEDEDEPNPITSKLPSKPPGGGEGGGEVQPKDDDGKLEKVNGNGPQPQDHESPVQEEDTKSGEEKELTQEKDQQANVEAKTPSNPAGDYSPGEHKGNDGSNEKEEEEGEEGAEGHERHRAQEREEAAHVSGAPEVNSTDIQQEVQRTHAGETPTGIKQKAGEERDDETEEEREEQKGENQENPPDKEKETITGANATNQINTTPGDSDGSTAASHTTSPLLLLLVVACAAAAAVVAA